MLVMKTNIPFVRDLLLFSISQALLVNIIYQTLTLWTDTNYKPYQSKLRCKTESPLPRAMNDYNLYLTLNGLPANHVGLKA